MARKRALRNRPKQVEEEYKSEESASEPEDAQLGTNYSSEEDISDCEVSCTRWCYLSMFSSKLRSRAAFSRRAQYSWSLKTGELPSTKP